MRRFLKWLAIGLAALVGIAFLAAAGMMLTTDARLAKTYTVNPTPLTIAADPAAVEQRDAASGAVQVIIRFVAIRPGHDRTFVPRY